MVLLTLSRKCGAQARTRNKNPRELKNQNKKNQLKEWLMNQLKESAKEEINNIEERVPWDCLKGPSDHM